MEKRKKIKAGFLIGDKYKILRPLEKGGMGMVYKAVHTGLDRKVAIKVLHPSLTENKRLVSRFVQEAKMIAMVQHRNIVDVLDVGYTSDGIPFFVMEYLHGESLKAIIKKDETVPIPDIISIMKDALSGLSFAHGKGIIHRDMKPGNIFLAREHDNKRTAKILDFGISKLLSPEGERKDGESTFTGAFLGTPAYMSPEQAKGNFDEVDTRSDIYSCGVIMYKLLTGMTPFRGDTFVEMLHNVISAPIPPPSFMLDSLPTIVDTVVMTAMERDPKKRYQDCQTFIDGIDGMFNLGNEKSLVAGDGESKSSARAAGLDGDSGPMDISVAVGGECSLTDESAPVDSMDSVPSEDIGAAASMAEKKVKKKESWSMTSEEEPPPLEVWKKRLPWLVPLVLAVIAVPVIILSVTLGSSNNSEDESKALQPNEEKAADSNPIPQPGKQTPKTVSIFFTGFPAGAQIILNDKIQNKNPITLEYGEKPVSILVRKDGKEFLKKITTPVKDMEFFYSVETVIEKQKKPKVSKGTKKTGGGKTKGKKKKKKEDDDQKPTIIKKPVF